MCCLFVRAVWPGAMVLFSVVFALLFQVSKWVSGCVVLEAVRVVQVIICKCVVRRGVALECLRLIFLWSWTFGRK